ncbi:MAG: hypothetical protein KF889_28660 [Alphaproteobacteria bacterium]|nr:hypothetical protein [Alphaproteobacteria bacterium]MCW5743015.1 hypothetical protein [Alphaproteobacteria bacterium]
MAGIDKKEALVNPSQEFDKPKDVVESRELSRDEKRKALEQWEIDARLMQVASEEGMTGGEPNRLDDVKKAQKDLGLDEERKKKGEHRKPAPPPTKAGADTPDS